MLRTYILNIVIFRIFHSRRKSNFSVLAWVPCLVCIHTLLIWDFWCIIICLLTYQCLMINDLLLCFTFQIDPGRVLALNVCFSFLIKAGLSYGLNDKIPSDLGLVSMELLLHVLHMKICAWHSIEDQPLNLGCWLIFNWSLVGYIFILAFLLKTGESLGPSYFSLKFSKKKIISDPFFCGFKTPQPASLYTLYSWAVKW